MRIIQHERFRTAAHFSIERLFAQIRCHFPAGYDVDSMPCPCPSRGIIPRLRNVVVARRRRADVHHIVGDVHYLAFGLPSRKTVLTIHDCAALSRLTGWRRAVLKFLWFRGPVQRAAVTTTISRATKAELQQWLGSLADRIEVVPDCVPDEFVFCPQPFNEVSPVCLQVGTKWNKNLERVGHALRNTSCRLEIVGTLSDTQMRALADAGVDHRELGTLTDEALLEAYRRCDFVMFASLYEGFGLPILEAQATGRPVITSNRSSLPEAAGDGALLVDPLSVDSIADAVRELLRRPDLRGDLIERGRQNVARFTAESVARQYASIYDRVAGAASSS